MTGRGTSCTCEAANDLATWHNGRCALYQSGRSPSPLHANNRLLGDPAGAGRVPSPCWGAFDAVAFHGPHTYDGKWCPGFESGRSLSSTEEAAMSGDCHEICDFVPGPAELEDEPDRHLPCTGCDCCEAESCEALLCMDCPCHAPDQGRGSSPDGPPNPVSCPHGTEGCLYCNTRWHKATPARVLSSDGGPADA